jgi:hypothetical protein
MRSILTLTLAICLAAPATAQLSQGGLPYEWEHLLSRQTVPVVGLEAIPDQPDPHSDALVDGEFNYGVQRFVEVDVVAQGEWQDLEEGGRLCRIAIASEGAVMLSLQFDRWELPQGALIYLYDEERTTFIGGFDHSNRLPDGTMATAVLPGDRLVLEYRVPAGMPAGELRIASLTHGYRDLFGFLGNRDIDPGYQSSPCNVNVACPEAAQWQDQKRSVALFLRPTGAGCTGVLLNNTAQPGRPFFHVAGHCYQATEAQWVFYFNYESPGCVGNVGPSNQTLTGATYRAGWYYDDFVLLELFNTPPASYNVFYAGWDRSGNTPQSGTVIHHPLYDVKKITFNYDPATSFTHQDGWQLWRNYWDHGLVQAVSSGSPMFDQNKRMVGHMFDGAQDCATATTVPTDCAKFSVSWDGGSPSTRLRDWLDPANTTVQLDGYDPNGSPLVKLNVRAHLEGPFNTSNLLMNATLRSNGLVPLTEPYSALGYAHVNGGGGETTTSAVLAVTGTDAVVDWVVVELRNKNNSQQVLATRSALLQRDGDIVDLDGMGDLTFNVPADQYFVAVRHRNHLGIMTAVAQPLSNATAEVDMGSASLPLFGGSNATKTLAGKLVMFAGDANADNTLSYTGLENDRDLVLVRVGGSVPTDVTQGYHPEDFNMDGVVRYTGANNDRDIILSNIGGTVPTSIRQAQLP